jgi:hypothetical protein
MVQEPDIIPLVTTYQYSNVLKYVMLMRTVSPLIPTQLVDVMVIHRIQHLDLKEATTVVHGSAISQYQFQQVVIHPM